MLCQPLNIDWLCIVVDGWLIGQVLKALDGHTDTIVTVAALTNGNGGKIVSGSVENTVRVLAGGLMWLVEESMTLGR